MISPVYAITDPKLLPIGLLEHAVTQALIGGVKTIQLRDKLASESQLIQIANQLQMVCAKLGGQLIINDRVDIAKHVGASGVHLGQTDGDVRQARKHLGPEAIIGVTCHNQLNLAIQAEKEGASYVAFGRMFPSSTKPHAVAAPLSLIAEAKSRLTIPVVAIGGITFDNMRAVVQQGADSIAVCHALFAAANVKQRASQLVHQFTISQQ